VNAEPAPPRRASDVAYEALRARIVDLRLPPGSQLNEVAVAAELGLGRMPVHEAVARLANERFVTVVPRRGTTVSVLQLSDVLTMFEAREAVECGVAHIAARRATDDDITVLGGLVGEADRAREGRVPADYLREDHEVHAHLLHMVHNSLLQDAGDRLLLHNLRFWRAFWATHPPRRHTMVSHTDLLAALVDRDPDRAEAAMREHLAASRRLLQESFTSTAVLV
jgi:DNA-binding GntR family transcriptional regulator